MGNIRILRRYKVKPSAENVRLALEAVEAHEKAGNQRARDRRQQEAEQQEQVQAAERATNARYISREHKGHRTQRERYNQIRAEHAGLTKSDYERRTKPSIAQNRRRRYEIIRLHEQGKSLREIADIFGITKQAVHGHIKRHRNPSEREIRTRELDQTIRAKDSKTAHYYQHTDTATLPGNATPQR